MNRQLELYRLEVADLDAPAPEKLQIFYRRDELVELQPEFTDDEQLTLQRADQELLRHIDVFASCTRFAEQRRQRDISPSRWWWYLDVISYLLAGRLAVPSEEEIKAGKWTGKSEERAER